MYALSDNFLTKTKKSLHPAIRDSDAEILNICSLGNNLRCTMIIPNLYSPISYHEWGDTMGGSGSTAEINLDQN